MPFPSAPTSGQKTDIRESYAGRTYAIFAPNTVVFKAQVSGTPPGSSITEVMFDNVTIGTIAAALLGYSIRFSRTDDIYAAYYEGRVRSTEASGTTLMIAETSAAIQDNDFIFVVEDVKLRERLPFVDENGDIFVDYDVSFEELVPVIQGLQSAYVIQLSGGNADLALAPSVLIPTNGAAADTWNWSQVAGASFQAGSSSSQNVTLRWATSGVKRVRVEHTDDGGRVGWFTFVVAVVDADFDEPLLLGEDDVSWSLDLTEGGRASMRAFDGVETILDETLVILFTAQLLFGDDSTPVVSNVDFIGRLRTESITTEPSDQFTLLPETRYTIEGPLAQLGRLPLSPFALRDVAVPTEYGEIDTLTLWRGVVFQATALCTLANVHSLTFDDTSDDFRIPLLGTEDASAADNLDDVMFGINAALVFAPQGELLIARNVNYLPDGDRPTSIYDFTVSDGDIRDFDITHEHVETIGRLIGYAGSYDAVGNTITVVQAIAPAVAPGSAQGRAEINSQVLEVNLDVTTAQTEAAARIARDLAQKNPKDRISVNLVDGLHWLMPSVHQVYTFTIDADEKTSGIDYDTHHNWICVSVEVTVTENSGKFVRATFERTTQSGDSLVFAQLPPGEVTVTVTIQPPIVTTIVPIDGLGVSGDNPDPEDASDSVDQDTWDDQQPDGPTPEDTETPDADTRGGNKVAYVSSGGVWVTNQFTKSSFPPWVNRSPSAAGMVDLALAWSGSKTLALQDDSPDTIVWRWANIWGSSAALGTTLANASYQACRFASSNTVAHVYSYDATLNDSTCLEWDFTELDELPDSLSLPGNTVFVAGSGIRGDTPATDNANLVWASPSGAVTLTHIEVDWQGSGIEEQDFFIQYQLSGGGFTSLTTADGDQSGFRSSSWSGSQSADEVRVVVEASGSGPVNWIYRLEVCYEVAVTGAASRRSSNGGESWAGEVEVGTSPGNPAGFDAQRLGTAVLAAADEQVRKATGGGAYGDATNGDSASTYAAAICYYGKSADHYLFATADGTLFKVDGSGKNDITPNDGSSDGVATGQHCLSVHPSDTDRVYAILDFGGTHKLARSTDGGDNWSITSGFSSSAVCVDCSPYDKNKVIVGDGQIIYYSADGGANFVAKQVAGGGPVLYAVFKR